MFVEAKKNVRCVEATVVNAPKTSEQSDKVATSTKMVKNTTVFPSISRELHDSSLLNGVFEEAIYKHDPNASIGSITNGKCKKHGALSQNVSIASLNGSAVVDETLNDGEDRTSSGKRGAKKTHSACHYSDLFGSKEQLTNLIRQEGRKRVAVVLA